MISTGTTQAKENLPDRPGSLVEGEKYRLILKRNLPA